MGGTRERRCWQQDYWPGPRNEPGTLEVSCDAPDTEAECRQYSDHSVLFLVDSSEWFHHRPWVRPYLRAGRHLFARIPCGPRGTRWIVPAGAWDFPDAATAIGPITGAFRLMDIGGSTPGVAGIRWQEHTAQGWAKRPSWQAAEIIKEESSGGRWQVFSSTNDRSIRLDKSNAYLGGLRHLPTRSVRQLRGNPERRPHLAGVGQGTWFMECSIMVHGRSGPKRLSPLPLRLPARIAGTRPEWQPEPGTYTGWLWREQYLTALEAGGYTIEPLWGYGWSEWYDGLHPFIRDAEDARRRARLLDPTGAVDGVIKRVIQSGIGIHACLTPYEIADAEDVTDGEEWSPLRHESPACPVVARDVSHGAKTRGMGAPMVHWWSYTVMLTQLDIYQMALPFFEEGSLQEIRTDCVVVDEQATITEREGYRAV